MREDSGGDASMTYFDDLIDTVFGWVWGEVPEEVKKARENLEKAREEYYKAQRKAWRERIEKGKNEDALALPRISLGGTEEDFRSSVERFAKANPQASVKAESMNFPNGWYRSVRIEENTTDKR